MNATAVQRRTALGIDAARDAPSGEPVQRSATGGRRTGAALPVQYLLTVGRPDDPLEREAEGLATRVQASSAPAAAVQAAPGSSAGAALRRAPVGAVGAGSAEAVQQAQGGRPGAGPSGDAAGPAVRRAVAGPALPRPTATVGLPATGGGHPMAPEVRARIEPHLGAPLDTVRVHTGPDARRAATALQARAFTHRDQIFLGPRESADDIGLMAHEAAHVVQQGAAADRIQLLPDFILGWAGDFARMIPGYDVLSLIAGHDLISGRPVAPTPAAVARAILGIFPGGALIARALDEVGILGPAADFVAAQLAAYDLTMARIERTITTAVGELDALRWDVFQYNYDVIARHVGDLWRDVCAFASSIVGAVLDLIKEAAVGVAERLLPGPAWSLLTKILHHDPLRGVDVDAPMVEIVEDFLRLIGREQELEEMRKRGTLQETADWLSTQLGTFQELLGQLSGLFTAAWAAIQPENLPHLMTDLRALAGQVVGFLGRVWSFATTVASTVLSLIKKALLGWLSGFAHELPGFHLVTVILGRNPFTSEPVPRTAENIIKGFITLLPGGEAQYQQLAESGVIGSAAARIEGAMAELGISWELVRETFLGVWNSLSIQDLVEPIAAFERIRAQFGVPIGKLFEFVKVVIQEIITLILALMNFPSDVVVRIITNAMQAWEDIKRDPVAFLLNMLAAVKAGFAKFFDKILTYLLSGLTDWLFRGLKQAGIEPPKEITLGSVLELVMKVLGITTEKLWAKLADKIGQDKVDKIRGALDKLEGIWTFVKDVQERGVAAIWDYIKTQIGSLWDMVLQKVQSWIMEKIVDRVVAKLLSMLDPTGVMAVVNSFIAFFNAVQSAMEYMREILMIIDDYVSTLAAVARGDVEPGAAKIEQGLAAAVPVAIGFLANQVGLGNIGDKITEILEALREVVDKALDWLLDKAMQLGQAVLNSLGLGQKDAPPSTDSPESRAVKEQAGQRVAAHSAPFGSAEELDGFIEAIISDLRPHGLKALRVQAVKNEIGKFEIEASASPFGTIGMVLGHVEGPPTEALELALDTFSKETHAFALFPGGQIGHYVSGGGLHAETRFIGDLEERLGSYPVGALVPIVLNINRTPCTECSTNLTMVKQSGVLGRRLALTINATNLYAGAKWEEKLAEGGKPGKKVKFTAAKTAMDDLEMMEAAGIHLGIWDIWAHVKAGLDNDPQLEGLDKAMIDQNIKQSERLRGWLQNVQVNLHTKTWNGLTAK